MTELDEDFEKVLMGSGGGSLVQECGCGRTHFACDSGCFEEGEREDLEEQARSKPDKFIAHEFESVSWRIILGRTFVYDCPCEYAKKASQLLWEHREKIVEYIRLRAERQARDARLMLDAVDDIRTIKPGRRVRERELRAGYVVRVHDGNGHVDHELVTIGLDGDWASIVVGGPGFGFAIGSESRVCADDITSGRVTLVRAAGDES